MISRPPPAPPRTRSASVAGPAARAARPPVAAARVSAPATRSPAVSKGFNNPFRVEYQAVNLHTLGDLVEKTGESTVDPDVLVANGIVHKKSFVKVLARGEISTKVDLHVHAISAAAETAVKAAGGTVTLIELPFREEGKAGRPAVKGNQFANR
jgi:large subunit ribosomal protein L15